MDAPGLDRSSDGVLAVADSVPSDLSPPSVSSRVFVSLQNREFRLLWFGLIFSFLGFWLQNVAQGWWVLEQTNSPFLLSVVSASGQLPMLLFSLVGGAVADRVDRRRLLIATRTILLGLLLVLATLIGLGMATVWHVIVISLLTGLVWSFDIPSRQALVPSLVGQDQLMNAMALNSAVMNGTQILGPALAGNLVGVIGTSGCFFLAAFMYLGIVVALIMMRVPKTVRAENSDSMLRNVVESLALLRRNTVIGILVVSAGVVTVFGMPYAVFMPVFARDVLGSGTRELGLLLAATGFGALVGALALAFLGNFSRKGLLLLGSGITFALALLLFSFSRWLPLSFGALMVVGMAGSSSVTIINTLVLSRVAPEYQGRMMAVFMLTWGMQPLGSLLMGSLANPIGAPAAVAIGSLACLVYIVAVFSARPSLARLS